MRPQPESSHQEVLAGLIERVTYHNSENGFCVLRAKVRGHRDVVTVVGHAATIAAGEWIAIVIDDGIATGATTRATHSRKPKKLILAVPVAPADSLAAMQQEADEVVCLEAHTDLRAIGYYYSNFWPVPDDEVIELLARFSARKQKQSSQPRPEPGPKWIRHIRVRRGSEISIIVHVSSKVAPAAHEHMLLRDLRSAVEHMEKCIPRTNLSCRGCSTGWLPLFYHSAMA